MYRAFDVTCPDNLVLGMTTLEDPLKVARSHFHAMDLE